MTKKDYERIAAALKTARADIQTKEPGESHADLLDGVAYAAEYLADTLFMENSRFDRTRFLTACGVQS